MRYIFTNVGRGNVFRQRKAFSVSKSVAKTTGRRGFVEIGESDGKINEPLAMKLAFPSRKWARVSVETHTPVIYPKSNPAKVRNIFAVKGKAHTFPTKHWVRVTFTDDKVVLINGHMPPGAFNGKYDSNETYRRESWVTMWDILKAEISKAVRGGYSVVVMTDANRQKDMPTPHKDARLVAHHKTDYIWAIPAPGHDVKVGQKGTKEVGIDFHRVLWADVTFPKQ